MYEIRTAAHRALLDLDTGVGLLVLPHLADDIETPVECEPVMLMIDGEQVPARPASTSLHDTDHDDMMRKLHGLGWAPLTDDRDCPLSEGHTADGRPVVALYGRDVMGAAPSLEDCERARRELLALAC